MNRLLYYLTWLRWYLEGPSVDHLNPGDTQEDYFKAHAIWVGREPKL